MNYVLIGALAATVRGFPRATFDADITPEKERKNLGRLAAALREINAQLRVPGLDYGVDFPLDETSFDQGSTFTFVTDYGPLDVILWPDGTKGYEDLSREAESIKVFGIEIQVASLADIIRSKAAAGRPKDKEDLRQLRELQNRSGE